MNKRARTRGSERVSKWESMNERVPASLTNATSKRARSTTPSTVRPRNELRNELLRVGGQAGGRVDPPRKPLDDAIVASKNQPAKRTGGRVVAPRVKTRLAKSAVRTT